MLRLPSLGELDRGMGAKIYLCTSPTDMRKGFDTLAALVKDFLGQDPLSGHLFLFIGRAKDRLKLLYWDADVSNFCGGCTGGRARRPIPSRWPCSRNCSRNWRRRTCRLSKSRRPPQPRPDWARLFKPLASLGPQIAEGCVFCLCPQILPLAPRLHAVPVTAI